MTNSDHDDDRNQIDKHQLIPRLLKSEMTQQIPYIMDVDHYIGPKKPLPPEGSMTVQVPTLVTLSETAVILNRAKEKDLEFLKSIHTGSPEYNGYNTKQAREEGVSLQLKTNAIYLPLIDMPPAEYDTILTSMLQIKRLSEAARLGNLLQYLHWINSCTNML